MKMKKILFIGAIIGAMGVGAMFGPMVSYADSSNTFSPRAQGSNMMGARMGQYFAGSMLDDVAEVLGMTEAELYQLRASGKSIADIAKDKGIAIDDLIKAMIKEKTEQLNQIVADGKITEEQKTYMLENMEENIKSAITNDDFGPSSNTQGNRGKGMMNSQQNIGPRMGQYFAGSMLDDIAQVLGITEDELYQLRSSGKSIADIAKDKGISTEKITETILKEKKEQLDQLVKDGKITEEQRDYIMDLMDVNIKDAISNDDFGPAFRGNGARGQGMMNDESGQSFQRGQGRGNGGGSRWSTNNK